LEEEVEVERFEQVQGDVQSGDGFSLEDGVEPAACFELFDLLQGEVPDLVGAAVGEDLCCVGGAFQGRVVHEDDFVVRGELDVDLDGPGPSRFAVLRAARVFSGACPEAPRWATAISGRSGDGCCTVTRFSSALSWGWRTGTGKARALPPPTTRKTDTAPTTNPTRRNRTSHVRVMCQALPQVERKRCHFNHFA